MFLGMLDKNEKAAFAILAEQMIDADGITVGPEIDALTALKREMGVSLEAGDDPERDPARLAARFSSRSSQVACLLELLGLAHVDSDYDLVERSLVSVLASEWGMNEVELESLDSWVMDHIRMIERAMALMRG